MAVKSKEAGEKACRFKELVEEAKAFYEKNNPEKKCTHEVLAKIAKVSTGTFSNLQNCKKFMPSQDSFKKASTNLCEYAGLNVLYVLSGKGKLRLKESNEEKEVAFVIDEGEEETGMDNGQEETSRHTAGNGGGEETSGKTTGYSGVEDQPCTAGNGDGEMVIDEEEDSGEDAGQKEDAGRTAGDGGDSESQGTGQSQPCTAGQGETSENGKEEPSMAGQGVTSENGKEEPSMAGQGVTSENEKDEPSMAGKEEPSMAGKGASSMAGQGIIPIDYEAIKNDAIARQTHIELLASAIDMNRVLGTADNRKNKSAYDKYISDIAATNASLGDDDTACAMKGTHVMLFKPNPYRCEEYDIKNMYKALSVKNYEDDKTTYEGVVVVSTIYRFKTSVESYDKLNELMSVLGDKDYHEMAKSPLPNGDWEAVETVTFMDQCIY